MGAAGAPPAKRSTTLVIWGVAFRVGSNNGSDNGNGGFAETGQAWEWSMVRLTGKLIVHVHLTCIPERMQQARNWWRSWELRDPSKARARPLLDGGYSVAVTRSSGRRATALPTALPAGSLVPNYGHPSGSVLGPTLRSGERSRHRATPPYPAPPLCSPLAHHRVDGSP